MAWVDYEHGWPLVFLRRSSPEIGRWSLTRHVTEFDFRALACDTGIFLLGRKGDKSNIPPTFFRIIGLTPFPIPPFPSRVTDLPK